MHSFGEKGLKNPETIVQKCIALGMQHCWSEPETQMFLVYVSCKGGFFTEAQENGYIHEIMAVYSRKPLLDYHVSFVFQDMS